MPLAVEHLAAVVGEKSVGFVQPILHTHKLLILRHQLGVVDKHGDQPIQMGQLLFVQVVFCHQRVAFENFAVRCTLPCGQAHGGAVQRCPLGNQLCRRHAGDGIVQLVLHEGIERFRGFAVFVVVVAALLKHIGNFLVSSTLAGADFPDAL